jgi:hypothetical protein
MTLSDTRRVAEQAELAPDRRGINLSRRENE